MSAKACKGAGWLRLCYTAAAAGTTGYRYHVAWNGLMSLEKSMENFCMMIPNVKLRPVRIVSAALTLR